MDSERKKDYVCLSLFFIVLLLFAVLDWRIYKGYSTLPSRKPILEVTHKQPTP